MDSSLFDIAQKFRQFALLETRGSSPLYEKLCLDISQDSDLLSLALETRQGQPPPNLFMATLHWLLMQEPTHALARHYPNLFPNADQDQTPESDPFPLFKDFCMQRQEVMRKILSERRVQTNVVERCGLLLPGFTVISERTGGKPMAMIEFGASAGLNLLWDKYTYDYGEGLRSGDLDSSVKIVTSFGNRRPPIFKNIPRISQRVGIDLNPIDVTSERETSWLQALVWPENTARFNNLGNAIAIAKDDPPTMVAGDAVDVLPEIIRQAPADSTPCVYHTHTVNQFTPDGRERLERLMIEAGLERDLYWLSSEYRSSEDQLHRAQVPNDISPTLLLTSFVEGRRTDEVLARCQTHGQWLEWLQAE